MVSTLWVCMQNIPLVTTIRCQPCSLDEAVKQWSQIPCVRGGVFHERMCTDV